MTDLTFAPIMSIRVGVRTRKDLGDIHGLAESITELGMLHPIVVTPDLALIAGQRRLAACHQLGWDEVPVRTVHSLTTAAAALRAERDENTCRKDFTPSEAVALGMRLEELERPAALERKAQAGRSAAPGRPAERDGDSPCLSQGPVRDIVGPAVGMTPTRYAHAKTVVAATADPDAEVAEAARTAQKEMDATGYVETAYRKVRAARDGIEPNKRSVAAVAARRLRLREMAETGHSRQQIAAELGIHPSTVKGIADQIGVSIAADAVMRGTRHIDPNRVVAQLVSAMEANPITLELIENRLHELDPDQVEYWTSSLGESLRFLNRFHKQLKELVRAEV